MDRESLGSEDIDRLRYVKRLLGWRNMCSILFKFLLSHRANVGAATP